MKSLGHLSNKQRRYAALKYIIERLFAIVNTSNSTYYTS